MNLLRTKNFPVAVFAFGNVVKAFGAYIYRMCRLLTRVAGTMNLTYRFVALIAAITLIYYATVL